MLARYRNLATPLAVIAAVILVYMENPWVFPKAGTTENLVATIAFWVLTVVVLVLMFEDRKSPDAFYNLGLAHRKLKQYSMFHASINNMDTVYSPI